MSLKVDFLNVGQGDATLIRVPEENFIVLVDGGTPDEIESHLSRLWKLPQIDLIIGTHADRDHIGGLCDLVRGSKRGKIKKALLPAFPTPSGELVPITEDALTPESNFFAANAISELGLTQVLEPLHEAVVNIGLVEEMSQVVAAGPGEGESGSVFSSQAEDGLDELPALQELMRLVSRVPGDVVAEIFYPDDGIFEIDEDSLEGIESFGETSERQVLRTGVELAEEVESLSTLDRLLTALDEKEIPWEVRCAPESAAGRSLPGGQGSPLEAWHIAPTEAYARQIAAKLPSSRLDLPGIRLERVRPGLPNNPNRISHVIAFRIPGDGPGVMITGDSGFQRARGSSVESMSDGWESTLEWARLIDVPHHGGTSGHFGDRLIAGLDGSPAEPLDLYLSVGCPNTGAPPYTGFDTLLPDLRQHCSGLTLWMSAIPRTGALGKDYQAKIQPPDTNPGPTSVQLENSSGTWQETNPGAALRLSI